MQQIQEIMTPNPRTCHAVDSVQNALEIMRNTSCGAVPIVDGDNKIQNIITDRDIALCLLDTPKHPKDVKIQDCVQKQRQIITIYPHEEVHRAIDLMEEHQVRRLPVCDDEMHCIGIVAQADIALKDRMPQDVIELLHDISEKRDSIGANP